MQQLLKSKDLKDPHPSAFQPFNALAKSPTTPSKKRDSGYGSDFSPAGLKSQHQKFTFDDDDDVNDDVDSELRSALGEMVINTDEEVFDDHFEPIFHVINESDENDETDKEVEELLCQSDNLDTENVETGRPMAPIPTPQNGNICDTNSVRGSGDLCLVASPYYHTNWNTRNKYMCRNPFHRNGSRSVGTQTPNPHCQLVQDALRSKKVTLSRGRLRLQSEGDQIFHPLPDVVPLARDRSISLPDVPSFQRLEHEQHVGRELRRISDDFHSVYLRRQRRRPRTRSEDPSASSRFHVDLPGYWNSLRRFVSSSPMFQAWSREQC